MTETQSEIQSAATRTEANAAKNVNERTTNLT